MSTTGRKADKEYVVFDEFHWLSPDHIEYIYRGWEYALANYRFLKQSYPNECLGLTTREDYMRKVEAMYGSYEAYQKRKQEYKLNIKLLKP